MISHISGTVIHSSLQFIVVDVAGVGYKVYLPTTESKQTGEEVELWTYLAVRENALDLYGFSSHEELSFFELLISVSGIGPRSALGILSVAGVDVLQSGIASGDTSYLTKVSGIGKKNAEKIVLELKEKLGSIETVETGSVSANDAEVMEALTALGYSQNDARKVVKELPEDVTGTQDRIKYALKELGNGSRS